MAFQWVRAATLTTATVTMAIGALFSCSASAAAPSAAYCKSHPATAACKAAAKKVSHHAAVKKAVSHRETATHHAAAKESPKTAKLEARKTRVVAKATLRHGKAIAHHAPLSAAAPMVVVVGCARRLCEPFEVVAGGLLGPVHNQSRPHQLRGRARIWIQEKPA